MNMDFFQPQSIYSQEIQEEKQGDEVILDSTFYTLVGEEDSILDGLPIKNAEDDKVYAKKIKRKDGSIKYVVKLSKSGKLYNPISMYNEEHTPNTSFLDRVCRSDVRFKMVNQKAFDLYLKFLTTKNLGWLTNAQREVI